VKIKLISALWVVCLLAGLLIYVFGESGSEIEAPIYNESADGAKQIHEALAVAKKENKRVLLQFGANWCEWCHELHKLLDTDKSVKTEIEANYIVILIDVNGGHNEETVSKYGHPTDFGLPVIVILDTEGKQLVTQNTGEFVDDGQHNPKKVLAFLDKWKAY
jgi:thiol:disulfide interchange protein